MPDARGVYCVWTNDNARSLARRLGEGWRAWPVRRLVRGLKRSGGGGARVVMAQMVRVHVGGVCRSFEVHASFAVRHGG